MKKEERKYLTNLMRRVRQDGAVVVELGSYLGDSSEALAKGLKKKCRNAKLFCVDYFKSPFNKNDALRPSEAKMAAEFAKGTVRARFERRMKRWPHITLATSTIEAARWFADGTLDLVFIDADHSYEGVKNDIAAWGVKVRPGGILCGHDYIGHYVGVKRAVDEFYGRIVQNPVHTMWEVHK